MLFKNLFGEELVAHASPETELLGEFMAAWVSLEAGLRAWVERNSFTGQGNRSLLHTLRSLESASIIDKKAVDELNTIRKIRNDIVHGMSDYRQVLTPDIVKQIKEFAEIFTDEEA